MKPLHHEHDLAWHDGAWSSYDQLRLLCEDMAAVDYYLALDVVQRQTDIQRTSAGQEILLYSLAALSRALRDGHSCLDLRALAGEVVWRTPAGEGAPSSEVWRAPALADWQAALSSLVPEGSAEHPIVLSGHRLYLRRYWRFEQEVAERLQPLLADVRFIDSSKAQAVLRTLFPKQVISGDTPVQTSLFDDSPSPSDNRTDWQEVAVANALRRRLAIIAGGPGTGKTTSVIKLLYALLALNPDGDKIKLAAPTGKAAQRLTESVQGAKERLAQLPGIDPGVLQRIPSAASTLHRLLGVIPNTVQFRHHQDNPLDLDVLLLDEVSMVDLPMMTRLLRALPADCRIIMLGDADQLPSVAAGSVLADLAPRPFAGYSVENTQWLEHVTGYTLPVVASPLKPGVAPEIRAALGQPVNADHVVFLRDSHRFSDDSAIGQLAQQVIAGDQSGSWRTLCHSTPDVIHVPTSVDLPTWIAELTDRFILAIYAAQDIAEAWQALQNFRLLAAVRNGPQGVQALNDLVEQRLRQLGRIPGRQTDWYERRPVMVTQNHYGVRLFNGDIGITWRGPDGRLAVYFDSGQVDEGGAMVFRAVTPGRLPPVETVYAMTIHKTQGSEFTHVAMVLPDTHQRLLSRELIYTGVTRARRTVTVWCSESVWQQSVASPVVRYSGLGVRLQIENCR
ncbi:exodeoxyribonuclease V subunit alpha [Salinispirillum sp. LH 10-3-1]|uniref:RecBCD enzyme subunit RecD n=1 Tax=Salinispirillum sp. LH 10-3-1 TaxID=2952525 RepID=A0AB38YIN8_9GAMM